MNDQNGNHEFNLRKSFATDINVATKMVFAHGIKLREVTE